MLLTRRVFIIHRNREQAAHYTTLFTETGWTVRCETADWDAAVTKIVYNPPDLILIFADEAPKECIRTAYSLRLLAATALIPVFCVCASDTAMNAARDLMPDAKLVHLQNIEIEVTNFASYQGN